ncbi:hypothetical protein ACHAWX_006637 [Stephanocyclus meneghinianus]
MLTMPTRKSSNNCSSCPIVSTLCLIALPSLFSCSAFQMESSKPHAIIGLQRNNHNLLIRFATESNEDLSLLSDDERRIEGRQLAEQFYNDLKRRTATSSASDVSTETYDIATSTTPPKTLRKFTGKSSPSFVFANNSKSDGGSTNLQREREREFNLASVFERTFPIQAAVLLAFTLFVSLVGFSGDITDGSDRNFYGDDDLIEETVVEQLQRIRTDDSGEVSGKIWI